MTEFNNADYTKLMEIADIYRDFTNAVRKSIADRGQTDTLLKALTHEEKSEISQMTWKSFWKMFKISRIWASQASQQQEKQDAVVHSLKLHEYFVKAASRVPLMEMDRIACLLPKEIKSDENVALLTKHDLPVLAKLVKP